MSDTAGDGIDREAASASLRHALRQPLNHIISYSELLLEEVQGRQLDDLAADLTRIHEAARTLSGLMDKLTISAPGTGPLPAQAPSAVAFSENRVSAGISPLSSHLLVVDDDPANCDLLFRRLSHQGYRVSVARNGHLALAAIRQEPVDLVLLDVLMPEMDGFATCEQLKSQGETRDIPVIFMTGLSDVVDKVRGFDIGAVDYITKPFQFEEVLARIGAHLTLRRLTQQLQESEERLGRILESAMDAIVTLNESGEIVLFNHAAERIFRCPAAEALGKPARRFCSEALHRFVSAYAKAEQAQPPAWLKTGTTALRAQGDAFPVEGTLSRAVAHGRPLYTLILRDVQDKLRAETERQQLLGINRYLQEELRISQGEDPETLVGNSQDLADVMGKVRQVAPTSASVLILGETGTGKEVFARAIHSLSQRADKVMVRLNCAAIPADLVESELFGHEKGAFTSALARKLGRFELAHGGTLFLDEVGELALAAQAKLLRVLQEGEFERVGGTETLRVDVRIIAATNRDLQSLARSGDFRPDLFYRLNVFPIALPPLRQRKRDLPLLVEHFVRSYADKYGKRIETVSASAMSAFMAYDWPGNARELQHVIERAVILTQGSELAFDETILGHSPAASASVLPLETLESAERAHIVRVLGSVNWRVSGKDGAAAILGLKPTTLEFRMKKLGIARPG